jgi:hypothetical protein
MKYKQELIEAIKMRLFYEKSLKADLEEINQGHTRNDSIAFLESCLNELDALIASLERLVELAKKDTGGSRIAGLFLVNLYNSNYAHFSLRDLHNLDHSYWVDAMNVLKLDSINFKEVFEYIDDGENIFHNLIDNWSNK